MESYREVVRWPAWFHFVLAAGVFLLAGGAAGTLVRAGISVPAFLGVGAAAAVAAVWWRMRHLEVELGPAGAAFGFGGLRRRVPRDRIRSAEVEGYSAVRYMGWGYRIGWKPGERAYSLVGHARGLRVVFDDERGRRWSVFLSMSDPEAGARALGESGDLTAGPGGA